MVVEMGGMSIKSFIHSLRILLYTILFDQVNRTSFSLALNPNYIRNMRFSNQRVIHYFVDQFQYCLLFRYIKIIVVLKRQRFKDSENEETELRILKCQHVGMPNN